MTSPFFAGLGRGLSGLGQSIDERELRDKQAAILAAQIKRQEDQQAFENLLKVNAAGGTILPTGVDSGQALQGVTLSNNLRSGMNSEGSGPSAIPNSAMGIPDESTPNAFGSPSVQQAGGMNILLDPSRSPAALAERRQSLAQLAVDRRARQAQDAAAALEGQREAARATASAGERTPTNFTVNGKSVAGTIDKQGRRYDATGNPIAGDVTPYAPPQPPPNNVYLPSQGPNGETTYTVVPNRGPVSPQSTGIVKPPTVAGGQGAAAIRQKVAANNQQLAVIEDAIKELDAHESAVGLSRGVPLLGDMLNQRLDPKGVAARASIANIGSLQIHDRTGAAMTVHEEPRLAPFVPSVKDTPEAIRIKLGKLKQSILEFNAALQAGATAPTSAAAPPPARTPSYEEWKQSKGVP